MNIISSVLGAVGRTPLLRLDHGEGAEIYCKLEYLNPGGSAKDRAALGMLRAARAEGKLGKDTVVIEPTSGNTGVGLAMACAVEKIRLIIVMPDSMSVERRRLIAAYGAEIVLTPGRAGMKGAVEKAEALLKEHPDSFMPMQFENPANALAHYETTGPEILEALGGKLDILVCTVGTGGTLTGTARYLKEQLPALRAVAVEPAESPLLSEGWAGPHKIQGIGANFVPALLDRDLIDEVLTVRSDDAIAAARALAREDGLLCGISSGCAVAAARCLAARPENAGVRIAAVLPDGGERYLSAGIFD